jgi:hypothetical protein
MQKTELRGEFLITWDEPSVEPAETNRDWIAEVSAERPELAAKLGGDASYLPFLVRYLTTLHSNNIRISAMPQ